MERGKPSKNPEPKALQAVWAPKRNVLVATVAPILVIVFCFLCLCYHKVMERVRRSSDHREIRRLRKAQWEQEMDNLQCLVPSASKGMYRPAPQTPQDNLTKAIQQVL